ncbi:MAG: hypothetical protein ACE5GB_15695 [Acidimicrobiales bacterium]
MTDHHHQGARPAGVERFSMGVLAAVLVVLGGYVLVTRWPGPSPHPITIRSVDVRHAGASLVDPPTVPLERGVTAYAGYGAWVDVFDYSPPYAGGAPPVTPDDIDEMAADGVRTVYLQAARLDDRSSDGIQDPWLLAEIVHRAHLHDMAVVAWYLPKWDAGSADVERVRALDDFEVLGHRFDGVALDIEWIPDDLELEERNARLVRLSRVTDAEVAGPIGAIVLPPVLTEVVNPDLWPDFPWSELAPLYEVWMPMSYWSFRSDESGYGDGYAYNEESTRRLRADLGDPEALVHAIGGIGGLATGEESGDGSEPRASADEIDAFARSLADTGAIGGSVYDWNTLDPEVRERLAALFSTGSAADLAAP